MAGPSDTMQESPTGAVADPAASSNTAAPTPKKELSNHEARLYHIFQSFPVDEFDWAAYEGTYRGRALIIRLLHIGTLIRLPLPPDAPTPPRPLLVLMRTALERASKLLKSDTWDTQTYTRASALMDAIDAVEKGKNTRMDVDPAAGDHSGEQGEGAMEGEEKGGMEGPSADTEWVEMTRENEKKEYARLDVELRGYMSNLIKESIRLTYLAFAQLALKSGSHGNAMKNYQAAREYSTSPQHHLDLGLGIVETCLMFNSLSALPGHMTRLDATLERLYPPPAAEKEKGKGPTDMSLTAGDVRETREREAKGLAVKKSVGVKIHVAKGLVDLSARRYESAGRHFAEVLEDGGLGEWEGVAISTSDVCLVTALCVLATGDRDRIRRILLDRASFRQSLDDSQGWILDLTRSFLAAKYDSVDEIYKRVEPYLVLNPYLAHHYRELRSVTDDRAIVQYVEPFLSVKIDSMANSFGMSVQSMLRTLENLIIQKRIKAKIDLVNNVLELKKPDQRAKLINDALRSGKEANASSQAALLRMKLQEAGIVVDPRQKSGVKGEEEASETQEMPYGGEGGGMFAGFAAGSGTGAGLADTLKVGAE